MALKLVGGEASVAWRMTRTARHATQAHARHLARLSLPLSGRLHASNSSRRALTTDASTSASPGSSTLDTLSSQVDLSTSLFAPVLPYIEQLPTWIGLTPGAPHAYAVSLVVATIALRTAVTLPVTLWQRARTRRMAEVVGPQWEELKRDLPVDVGRRCRVQRKSHAEYKSELEKEMRSQLKALLKRNRCTPWPTIAIPLAVNVPLFVCVSLAIRTALLTPGSLIAIETIPWWSAPPDLMAKFEASAKILQARGIEGEALQKLTMMQGPTLSEVDKTMATPIGLGLLTLINVELGQWLRKPLLEGPGTSEQPREEVDQLERRRRKAREQRRGVNALRSVVIGNTLRAASIAFIVVASQAPAGLAIYWLSSASYTLIQNAVFAYSDKARAKALAQVQKRR